jgi:restriction endonuclease Mrr
LEVILPFVEGGDEGVGGSVMAEMRHGDKVLISADQGCNVYSVPEYLT